MDIKRVIVSRQAEKNLEKIPGYITLKLQSWIESVSINGLSFVRKIPGFHDEQLLGDRKRQRSIRLSKAYRAIYVIRENDEVEFIEILRVSKHDYK